MSKNRQRASCISDERGKRRTTEEAVQEMMDFTRNDPDLLDTHEDSEVASFYKGRSVFITGASGFVGKVSTVAIINNIARTSCTVQLTLHSLSACSRSYSDLVQT